MKKSNLYPLFASGLLLLTACHHTNPDLQQAEAYLETGRPGNALTLLKNLPTKNFSSNEIGRYNLLYTWAWDKCDSLITPRIDSMMQVTAKCYRSGDAYHQALVAYYRGRVARDLHRAPEAQDDFLKALSLAEGSGHHAFLSHVNSQIGLLYLFQEEQGIAFPHLRQAAREAAMVGDSMGQAYTLQDLARAYSLQPNYDSTLFYYKQALRFMRKPASRYVLNEMADTYNRKGVLDSALRYAHLALPLIQKGDNPALFYIGAGEICMKSGQADSAAYYFKKTIATAGGRLDTRGEALYRLGRLALLQKDYNAYISYQHAYEQVKDSTDSQAQRDALLKMQSLYNYNKAVKRANAAEKEMHYLEIDLSFGFVLLLFVLAFIFLYSRYRKIRDERDELSGKDKKRQEWKERNLNLEAETIVQDLESGILQKLSAADYKELAEAVNRWQPDFILHIPNHEKLTPEYRQTAYLVRINLRTAHIARLLNIQRNSASARIKKLAEIVFDGKLDKEWHTQLYNYFYELE
jgi:hypothetical protein